MRLLLTAVLLLGLAAPAHADNASLHGTWTGYHAQLDYFPANTRSTKAFRRVIRRFERVADGARRALSADAADDAIGAKARAAAIAHLRASVASTRFFRRHLLRVLDGGRPVEGGRASKPTAAERRAGRRFLRLARRYGRLVKRADRAQRRADRLFAAL